MLKWFVFLSVTCSIPTLADGIVGIDLGEAETWAPKPRPAMPKAPPAGPRVPAPPPAAPATPRVEAPPPARPHVEPIAAPTPARPRIETPVPAAPAPPPPPPPKPARNLLKEFRCEDGKYTNSTEDVQQLFRSALGLRGVTPGRFIVENEGYSGTRVIIRIAQSSTVQLEVLSHNARISGRVCVGKDDDGKTMLQMAAHVTGRGNYTIYITNSDGMYLTGSGMLGAVLNSGFTMMDNDPRTARARR